MKIGTIVRQGDRVGVVVPNLMGCCGPDEEPVVFDGSDAFRGTRGLDLVVEGEIETDVANPAACGMGAGENCCRYLLNQGGAFICGRFTSLRNKLLLAQMTSRYVPTALFQPDCQPFAPPLPGSKKGEVK